MNLEQEIIEIMQEYGKIGNDLTFSEQQCVKAILSTAKVRLKDYSISYEYFFDNVLQSMMFYGIIDSSKDASANKCISKMVAILANKKRGEN